MAFVKNISRNDFDVRFHKQQDNLFGAEMLWRCRGSATVRGVLVDQRTEHKKRG